MLCSKTYCLIFNPLTLPSRPPPLSPRGSSGTAGETFPHRDRATGSEDQGLSERVLLWSVFVGDATELFTYLVMYKILRLIALTFKSRESVFFICSFPSPLCFFYYCRLICNNQNLTCFLSFFLRKFICPGVPAFDYSHLSAMCPSHPRKRSNQLHYI